MLKRIFLFLVLGIAANAASAQYCGDLTNKAFINVKTDCQAAGDGQTNDAPAINEALMKADKGGIVFLPPGTYYLSQSIVFPKEAYYNSAAQSWTFVQKPVILQGVGPNSILSYQGPDFAVLVENSGRSDLSVNPQNQLGDQNHRFVIRDLQVSGHGGSAPLGSIRLTHVSYGSIENVTLSNLTNPQGVGILMRGHSLLNRIKNLNALYPVANGIKFAAFELIGSSPAVPVANVLENNIFYGYGMYLASNPYYPGQPYNPCPDTANPCKGTDISAGPETIIRGGQVVGYYKAIYVNSDRVTLDTVRTETSNKGIELTSGATAASILFPTYDSNDSNLFFTNGGAPSDMNYLAKTASDTNSQIHTEILSTRSITSRGNTLGFFGSAPTPQPGKLLPADVSPVDTRYGKEEAAVVENLRKRINELELKLKTLGLLQ